jgi:hypothetical protein
LIYEIVDFHRVGLYHAVDISHHHQGELIDSKGD